MVCAQGVGLSAPGPRVRPGADTWARTIRAVLCHLCDLPQLFPSSAPKRRVLNQVMGVVVAGQAARVRGAVIRNRPARVRRHNIGVKVDQSLTRDTAVLAAHPMRGVAGGARESIINMSRVLAETRVRENLIQVVAL